MLTSKMLLGTAKLFYSHLIGLSYTMDIYSWICDTKAKILRAKNCDDK